jgi:ribonuclease D
MEGAILNKDACLSNWEARPLSKKQLKYAALDAAVLLPLFLELHHSVPVSYSDLVSSFSAPGRSRKRNEETTTATAVESGGQKQLKK